MPLPWLFIFFFIFFCLFSFSLYFSFFCLDYFSSDKVLKSDPVNLPW